MFDARAPFLDVHELPFPSFETSLRVQGPVFDVQGDHLCVQGSFFDILDQFLNVQGPFRDPTRVIFARPRTIGPGPGTQAFSHVRQALASE